MPDLLAHVFIAYALCRSLSFRWEWITRQYITVGMVGAFIPDLTKIKLVVSKRVVEQTIGYPFDWGSLHTGGGVFLSVLIGVVLLSTDERRRGGLLLGIGAGSHLLADSLLLTPTRHTQQLFWPLFQYRVPSPGLYLSTQPEPTLVTGGLAALVWAVHRRTTHSTTMTDAD
ncbi:metal-dependent hydrolase [Halorientalis marina]|uniref:metal-dependent hydrolase n=1 Tax=Halorientalis marina TaxID=2931976 RepID=UPI001FF3B6BF|nr:metal-dependent hydrolase [Halorientalis marina]